RLREVLAVDPDTGEEDLLVQSETPSSDEHEPGHGRDARLLQAVDDDGSDTVEGGVAAEERAAQHPRRLLHQGMTEMDMHEVVTTLRRLTVEGDRPVHARLETSVQATERWPP